MESEDRRDDRMWWEENVRGSSVLRKLPKKDTWIQLDVKSSTGREREPCNAKDSILCCWLRRVAAPLSVYCWLWFLDYTREGGWQQQAKASDMEDHLVRLLQGVWFTMPSICHSGPPHHDHHHLSLRFTPLCPPPTTQAHPTVDTQHHSGLTHHRHLSLRLTWQWIPASVTQAQPITATCHSGSPHNAQHLTFCYRYIYIPAFRETDWPAVSGTWEGSCPDELPFAKICVDSPVFIMGDNVLWVGSLCMSLCDEDVEGVSTLSSGCITGIITGTLSFIAKMRRYWWSLFMTLQIATVLWSVTNNNTGGRTRSHALPFCMTYYKVVLPFFSVGEGCFVLQCRKTASDLHIGHIHYVPVLSSYACDHAVSPRISVSASILKCLASDKKPTERLNPADSQQKAALDMLLVCYSCILLVYYCTLYPRNVNYTMWPCPTLPASDGQWLPCP